MRLCLFCTQNVLKEVNCIQHMYFHELTSLFYNLLIFVHEFQSACDEKEQVERLIQDKGSKRSNTFHVTQGMSTLQFSCNDCIVILASPIWGTVTNVQVVIYPLWYRCRVLHDCSMMQKKSKCN